MDIKRLTKLAQSSKAVSSVKDAIDDVIQLSFNLVSQEAFVRLACPYSSAWATEPLLRELTNYRADPAAWQELQEITVDYMREIKEAMPFTDIIGASYADKGLSKALGQFLTPTKVADALPRFLDTELDKLNRGEPILVSELCSGAGTLLLSLLQDIYTKHPDKMYLVHAVAMDIEPSMVRMTTAQLMLSSIFHSLPLGSFAIHWGDAITEYSSIGRPTLGYRFISTRGMRSSI